LKPLTAESVALHITIARELLERERRRYFRHAVNLSVSLEDGDGEQRARITDLSEGGMAVRPTRPLKHGSVIRFEFELSAEAVVGGRGQVAWTNTEGLAGIFIQLFHGKGREQLEVWLRTREQLTGTSTTAETPC